jgi:TetR/AcrR family transcriptional repressor of nem operon
MARPKEFDRDQALERAMELFRTEGYEGASLDDLTRATGVGRQSLYDTFGDKRALYLAALARYRESTDCSLLAVLEEPKPLRVALREILDQIIEQTTSPAGGPGCMLISAAVERGESDQEVRRCVGGAHATRTRALERRFARAQRAGEIGAHHDPAALAQFFYSTIQGMLVVARSTAERRALEQTARVALSVLG